MVFDTIAFGARVKLLRKGSTLTQEQLAQRLHISVSHLGKIEIGCNAASIDLILEMAEFFGVSVDYLLRGEIFPGRSDRMLLSGSVSMCPLMMWYKYKSRDAVCIPETRIVDE